MRITHKVQAIVIASVFICGAVGGFINTYLAHEVIEKNAHQTLTGALQSRDETLKQYLHSIEEDLNVLRSNSDMQNAFNEFTASFALLPDATAYLQHAYIDANPNPTGKKEELELANDGSAYSSSHERYHPYLRQFLRTRGYYDIFFIDLEGDIVYTVFKERDYATNLANGQYRDTDLGKLYRQASNAKEGEVFFSDFRPYAPSADAPASFIATPMTNAQGETIGVLAFQMPVARINAVMSSVAGLGETGEAFLVGKDYLLRTPHRGKDEKTILKDRLQDSAVDAALRSEKGIADFTDSNGVKRTIAYQPLDFLGTRWAMIAAQDDAELYAALKTFRNDAILIVLGGSLILGLITYPLVSVAISRPLNRITGSISHLAEGDLESEIPMTDRTDEVGEIARATRVLQENSRRAKELEEQAKAAEGQAKEQRRVLMHQLADTFQSRVEGITQSLAAASTELHHSAEGMSTIVKNVKVRVDNSMNASQQTAMNVETVAASAEEMSASVREISDQVGKSSSVVQKAVSASSSAETQSTELQNSATAIDEVVQVITQIAGQINLLALNATIESARAGEAGKGFAVVAGEVKNLATQAGRATEEISAKVSNIQIASQQVVNALREIADTVGQVNQYSSVIASAVEEQSAVTSDIAQNMQNASGSTQSVSGNISEIAAATLEAAGAAEQVLQASDLLSRESEALNKELQLFLQEIRAG